MTEQLHQIIEELVKMGMEMEKHKQDAGFDYQLWVDKVYQALWESYKEFCKHASETQNVCSSSAPDFLGWLKKQELIGK